MNPGGRRHRTLVKNWSEDMQVQEDETSEYLRKRDAGQLLSQQIRGKLRQHKTAVQLEPPGDGFLKKGQLVVIQSVETEAFLSTDLDDELTARPHQKFAVTTAMSPEPMLRNTWIVETLPHDDDEYWAGVGEGHLIHYSQKVRFRLNPMLQKGEKPMYLASERLTPACHSKVTQQQEVSIADHGNFLLAWSFVYANPEFRFEMEGQPIKTNSIVVISHCSTSVNLASHKKSQLNDFGAEWEVFANKYVMIELIINKNKK